MIQKLTHHIQNNFPFLEKCRFFLAVSGGIDSMVLVHLFQHFNFEFGLLHCNFKLRGEESDDDMKFIHDYCEQNTLNLRIGFFETESIAKHMKKSIQETARILRYNWFYEQMEEMNASFVLTAHHLDDSLETFIINLSRGTGIDGLVGIPEINDKILRPLLPFSRTEIEEYAIKNNLKWREDSSNSSDKYLRNKIRHHIVPGLKELNPNFLDSFKNTQSHMLDAQSLVEDAAIMMYQQIAKENGEEIVFDLKKLKILPNYKSYLYQWLREFGFKAWEDIYDLVEAQSGKQVFSENFKLLKNRDELILIPITSEEFIEEYLIEKNQKDVKVPLNISICKVTDTNTIPLKAIFVDEDKLQFPLVLRRWKEGDVFQPYGMNGQSKKVSKFFKDEKFSLLDKENTWLLCSNDQIVWIVGVRQDHRFRIENNTKNSLQIQLKKELK